MSAFQFLFAAIGSALAISISSLLWPKLTNKPSPPALTQVKHIVEQTSLGKQAADVLGVSENQVTESINISDWAVAQGNAIVLNVAQSASHAVVSQIVNKLTEDQKVELQQILCSTSSATKQ